MAPAHTLLKDHRLDLNLLFFNIPRSRGQIPWSIPFSSIPKMRKHEKRPRNRRISGAFFWRRRRDLNYIKMDFFCSIRFIYLFFTFLGFILTKNYLLYYPRTPCWGQKWGHSVFRQLLATPRPSAWRFLSLLPHFPVYPVRSENITSPYSWRSIYQSRSGRADPE